MSDESSFVGLFEYTLRWQLAQPQDIISHQGIDKNARVFP